MLNCCCSIILICYSCSKACRKRFIFCNIAVRYFCICSFACIIIFNLINIVLRRNNLSCIFSICIYKLNLQILKPCCIISFISVYFCILIKLSTGTVKRCLPAVKFKCTVCWFCYIVSD